MRIFTVLGTVFVVASISIQLQGPGPFMSVDVHECVSLVRRATGRVGLGRAIVTA